MKKSLFIILFITTFTVILSCSKNNDKLALSAKTYVIVPGAWSSPSVWTNVKTSLEKSGNKVIVVQLPGHGSDQTAPQNITMDIYRDFVINTLNSVTGKVILVGHSLGGAVISEVAEKDPSKIEKLIYIAAFVPITGQSVSDLSSTDINAVTRAALRLSADNLTLDVLHDQIINGFIQDGTAEEQNFLLTNYKVEPAIPFTNNLTLTTGNYGSVPKYYIKTSIDQTITPDLQKRMLDATPGFTATYQLHTGHSPFLVKPDSVAILLTKISQ